MKYNQAEQSKAEVLLVKCVCVGRFLQDNLSSQPHMLGEKVFSKGSHGSTHITNIWGNCKSANSQVPIPDSDSVDLGMMPMQLHLDKHPRRF